jgi:RNA polymerase sigma-70 factor (ECF subfamily)
VKDAGELEALIDRVYEPTRRYALRRASPDEAEDAVSETMLLLWQQPERIPKDSEVGWSIGVCRKVLANMRRKRVRRESLLGRFVTQLLPVAPAPVISREPEITAALSALPERDREALLLAVWDELPAREVGRVLGVSANAAAIRIHRAKRRMRELLKEA